MFRSQEMSYFQLIMPQESAWTIMDQLGYLSKVEIIDHNPNEALINRPFANYVKRCDDLLVKISSVLQQARKLNLLRMYKCGSVEKFSNQPIQHTHTYLDKIEDDIQKKTQSFQEHTKNHDSLGEQQEYIQNYIAILEDCQSYTLYQDLQSSKFDCFVGIIKNTEQYQQQLQAIRFHRVIFRITKGNSFVQITRINESKSIFKVLFPTKGDYSKTKIKKVIDQMSIGQFSIPENENELQKKKKSLEKQLGEIINLIQMTYNQLCQSVADMLAIKNGISIIEYYRLYLIKEKELYHQLNKLKMSGRLFLGELWIPTKDIQLLEYTLYQIKEKQQNNPGGQLAQKNPPVQLIRPTHFELNEFTSIFQEIVNTYGVPRYQEINPAIVTIITFPFLFGIMFGDIGHGLVLFLFGIVICLRKNETFHSLRYLILLMGLFSFYSGLIYNDYLGLPLNLFGTCQNSTEKCVYPFGIDPMWSTTLEFNDSFKMKLSIIIAFFHMALGICLNGLNQIYWKDWLNLTCKFIPQMLFLICNIGYMTFLIVFKWLTHFNPPSSAPSIITTMISMVLNLGRITGPQMWDGDSQDLIQYLLLLISFITIPWMWLPNIINYFLQKKHQTEGKRKPLRIDYGQLIEESGVEMPSIHGEQHFNTKQSEILDTSIPSNLLNQKEEFTDLIVHETIETIEFILGIISNTASYLRLWALSLAHSQLSEVFYSLLLAQSLENGQSINLILGYPFWALITFGVLMCMDTMECFLHSLRLHWVEFQNKFYKGDGIQFQIYSFQKKIFEAQHFEF